MGSCPCSVARQLTDIQQIWRIMPALTKDLLVKAVAEETGFTGKQSVELVETLIELIKGSLVSGDDVLISGFGKFSVREKRNGKDGIQLLVTA